MKREIRVIGIDDSPFDKFKDKRVLVVGAIFKGGSAFEGILSAKVSVDGRNSTKKLTEMVNKSRFRTQLRAILLNGIALGGFNVIDIGKLNKKTGIPVIVVIRRMPDFKKIESVLEKLGQKSKFKLMQKAGKPVKYRKIYFQCKGIDKSAARDILKLTCTRSLIPEPIRVAHLITSGIVEGESRGRA